MANGWLEGKVAVVTGSGRGIGRGIAHLMASEGARVVVNDPGVNVDGTGHDDGPAAQVVEEIKQQGGTAVPNFDSVATAEGGENIIKTALDNFGRVDVLVNVAGILRDRMIFNMGEEEWDAVIQVHLKGHFNTIKPASILMRQQRIGRIINFSSTSGLVGNAGQANYGAAKAGIAGFTRVVARDLGRYGVTCNAIAPAAATRMTATVAPASRDLRARAGMGGGGGGGAPAAGGGGAPAAPAAGAGGNGGGQAPAAAQAPTAAPAQRPQGAPPGMMMASPEMVAPMACFLATDLAWNINGQIFGVSGGTVSLLNHPLAIRTIYKPGMWTLDELDQMVPRGLVQGIANPAPPAPDIEVPGRPAQS
jgi:NAD(P)-dependent dehydrogenase (short-subunit alcohol dehydrogenase family)